MHEWDAAVRHFEAALELNARMGGKPWVAHTQCDYARMLLARNLPGDGEKARELLHDALTAAQERGWKAIEEKVQRLGMDQAKLR